MKYLKTLDQTLKSLKDNTDSHPLPKEVVLQRVNILNQLSNRDVKLVFDKLKNDNLIDVMLINELDNYFITFNGLLFLEKGGYKRQENIKNTNLRFKKALNLFLLIATILGAIYSVIQIKEFSQNEKKQIIIIQNFK